MKKRIKKLLFRGDARGVRKLKYGIASGIFMDIDLNHKTQRILGLDEFEIMKDFKKLAKRSDVFVDVGASDGYYGLIYNKLNPKGQSYLFEGDPAFKEIADANFKLNSFKANYKWMTTLVGMVDGGKFVSLDSTLSLKGEKIFFKIDVDGGELDVLKGATRTIDDNECYFIIETHSMELEEDCIEFLRERGFSTSIIKNSAWRKLIPETRPIEHNRWFVASRNLL
ncbi:FkbM family methyltransferase [Halocola ammonii]